MARSFGEPLTKLRAVRIVDNGEPLMDPRTLSPRLHFAAKHPKFGDMPRTPRVRRRVADMLAQAVEALPPGIDIQIIEGFRPLAQQRFMYETLRAEFAIRHPEWAKATLHRVTNTMSAPPDDLCPPPHTTGGAVDLGLLDVAKGERLDMTSPFDWDETSAPTQMKGLPAGSAEEPRFAHPHAGNYGPDQLRRGVVAQELRRLRLGLARRRPQGYL